MQNLGLSSFRFSSLASKLALTTCLAALCAFLIPAIVDAHCEIPCGIYGDKTRFITLEEHIKTIEKSINKIKELSGKGDAQSIDQIVRWVNNKEEHANKVQEIATQYFMAQRIKPKAPSSKADHDRYLKQLTAAHGIIIHAMKCKQKVDQNDVLNLRISVKKLAENYFSKADMDHLKKMHADLFMKKAAPAGHGKDGHSHK